MQVSLQARTLESKDGTTWTSDLFGQYSQTDRLHQMTNKEWRVEVDVPNLGPGKIARGANVQFQWYLNKDLSSHSRRLAQQLPRRFDVLQDMTKDSQIEVLVRHWNTHAIEHLKTSGFSILALLRLDDP